jgi:hypothetical protein
MVLHLVLDTLGQMVEIMVAEALGELMYLALAAMVVQVVKEQSVSSGLVIPEHSHQLV